MNTQQTLQVLSEMEPGLPRGICLTPLLEGIKKGESVRQVVQQATLRWQKDYRKYLKNEELTEGL
jgi:hypothetical protein